MVVAATLPRFPGIDYRLGVPSGGYWRELLNSDAKEYGGSGMGNAGGVSSGGTAGPWTSVFAETDLAATGGLFLKAE